MSKRGAASELTHDNWNEEDEPEEAGTFRKASAENMATRKIKTARRRDATGSAAGGGGTSIFKEMSGFANFGAKTDNSAPSFSFFNKDSSKSSSTTTPSFSFSKTDSESKKSIFGGEETKTSTKSTFSFNNTNGTSESTTTKNEEVVPKVNGFGSSEKSVTSGKKTDSPFMTELKSLNETFLKWIKQHLDENVYVNLTPVLEDYKKYFQKISEKNADGKVNDKKEESNEKENKPLTSNVISKEPDASGDGGTSDKVAEVPKPAFSFSSKTDDSKKSEFSFGLSKTDDSKPASIFGNDSNSSNSGSGIKFGSGAPLTFGGLSDSSSKPFSFGGFATAPVATPATKEKTEEEENEDEPPKVIVNEVKEDDAIYEKKCKLFYMKDKEYVERGLGTLFLKKADEKTQLIVRANTNLGNILLNIIVGPSIGAMMRVGKNNVMVVCIPNPPIDPKSDNKTPVKMLIRVKTSEDADALLKILEEHKG